MPDWGTTMANARTHLPARYALGVVLLTLATIGWCTTASAEILRAIDDVETAAADCSPALAEKVAHLNDTLDAGKQVIVQLNAQNAKLERDKIALQVKTQELKEERAQLERVQTALTSGLIGALITAVVAVLGTLSRLRSSRFDRDYRHVEIIEKLASLREQGVGLPPELVRTYLHGASR